MADGIVAAGECELANIRAQKIVVFNLTRIGGQVLFDVGEANALKRATDQSRNVRMLFPLALAFQHALHVVRAAAFTFGGGD